MSLNNLPVFQNRLSTCEDELNGLIYEIDWALRKCKDESKTEIVILRTALSDYKKKYDSCRNKLKELVKKHEDLKVQFVSLDSNYQAQLTQLQEEVLVLRSSFQDLWSGDHQHRRKNVDGEEEEAENCQTIAHLREEVSQLSEHARELESLNARQDQEVQRLKQAVQQQQVEQSKQQQAQRESSVDLAALAEKARQRFLQEEAIHQHNFVCSLDAKIQRFRQHLSASSVVPL